MDQDVINKINETIAQESSLQEQLQQVQTKKAMLQNVLYVWKTCKDDPTMREYVQSVIYSFKVVVLKLEPL
jgi:ATP-dependent Clp protease adapter protein ClpS